MKIQKGEATKRKEDALKTIEMIQLELSKHRCAQGEISTLFERLEHDILFIGVDEDGR